MAVKKEAVKETAEKAVETVKADAKAATETVKKTAKKAAAKTTTAAKKTAAAAKKTVKKAADKKAEVKKAVAAKNVVQLQFAGKDIAVDAIVEAAKADFKANNKGAVKTVEVYLKPEENAAYYVINGVAGKVAL